MENNQKQNTDLKISIQLAGYKGVRVKRSELRVEKTEIENSLDYLLKSHAKIITVNKAAKKGNRVEIDFEVRHGGVKIENGASKNHPLILGEGRFLPGFEKELEGMSAGEEKNFSLKAPENWPNKRVAEKNLDFKVKMNLVQERQIPELNDEFAKSLGDFASIDALKESVSDGLMEEKKIKEKQRIRIELIEKVADNSKIETPENLIDQELERMVEEFKFSTTGFGLDFDKYLQEIKKTVSELKKDWKNQAEKRVRIAVCLKAIAEKEKIEVEDSEVEAKINEELKKYPNIEEVKKNIDPTKLKEYTKNMLRNEKVLGLIEKEAIIN